MRMLQKTGPDKAILLLSFANEHSASFVRTQRTLLTPSSTNLDCSSDLSNDLRMENFDMFV